MEHTVARRSPSVKNQGFRRTGGHPLNESPTNAALLEALRPLERCLSGDELSRLLSALALVSGIAPEASADLAAMCRQSAQSLPLVAEAIDRLPSSLARQSVGSRERDAETLVARLCQTDQAGLEFSMPTRALLGRAFLLAKLNFFKSLAYVLEEAPEPVRPASRMLEELIGETVFSKLSEELLLATIANPFNDISLRRSAARRLIGMWEDRLGLTMTRLPTILVSAWRARARVRAVFGTLVGVTELVSLVREHCEPTFIRYFVRQGVSPDEIEALREFLFGLPYEDLETVRHHMQQHGLQSITPEQVGELIEYPLRLGNDQTPSPEHMYHSYWRRRVRAEYRAVSGHPGPRKTAEGFIMEFLLRERTDRESQA